ncbi:Tetratricopeptide repeat protein [Rosistilla carotiformis]|uniref:Tetratricopeptide repeat protein n=1 Tax=Rosistilla carotiformis TaxID=2528017 RepID=A0A518JQE6_9BACT|nr:hypothetical protein [Rosistilla carotiformis]QDV67766.1 Tetratricopeptide repeat protein [Rosistilla carotiformis]
MNRFWKCLICVVVLSCHSFASEPVPALEQAIEAYNAGFAATDRDQRLRSFRRAELLFDRVVNERELKNASLYVNLGNAALGAQRIGPAIVAFQRALAIDPSNRQARQNLEHARTLLPDWVPRPETSSSGLGSLAASLLGTTTRWSADDYFRIAALAFLVTAITLALALRIDRKGLRNLAGLLAVVWIASLCVAIWKTQQPAPNVAVVTLPDTIARAADSINSPSRLPEPLPSGTEVQVMEDRRDWLRVRLFDGRDAWLPASSVTRLVG